MKHSLHIPVQAAALDGTPPEVGDTLELTVTATVSEISDGSAHVSIETVNGEPLPTESGKEAAMKDLEKEAAELDENAGY